MALGEEILRLKESGNFRAIPTVDTAKEMLDLSSNDYLGLAQDLPFRKYLLEYALEHNLPLGSSASRLLASHQSVYAMLEQLLGNLYEGKECLLFNSGYHANTGIVSAVADRSTLVLADRLVHASIIDGIVLSRASLVRFRHNDYAHLRQLLSEKGKDFSRVLIIAESVYSMDGDKANIKALVDAKKILPNAILYVDEAHAVGVEGPRGLGCVAESGQLLDVDIIVGTFGKALGGEGAFALIAPEMRDYLVNKARSLIFSTAIPPVVAAWTRLTFEKMLGMEEERDHLRTLGRQLGRILNTGMDGHIQPFIVGDAKRAVELSQRLRQANIKVLPIRTPTVPPGTERLRFSLSAAIPDLSLLEGVWNEI